MSEWISVKEQDDHLIKLLNALNDSDKSIEIPKNQTESEFLEFINSL